MYFISILSSFFLFLLCSSTTISGQTEKAKQHINLPATEAVLLAFENYEMVGIGESHWLLQQHQWIQELVRDVRFADKTRRIVVEFANALYQKTIDDYVLELDSVSNRELAMVWQNTCVSPFQTWDGLVYKQFFETVRDINSKLPKEKRIHVLAGDPPINWNEITEPRQAVHYLTDRDRHAAEIVLREMNKGYKVLVIYGSMHLYKNIVPNKSAPFPPPSFATNNITSLIEKDFPNKSKVFIAYIGKVNDGFESYRGIIESELEKMVFLPSVYYVEDSPISELPSDLFLPKPSGGFPSPVEVKGGTLSNMCDGILYFGMADSLSASMANPDVFDDQAYFEELNRRQMLFTKGNFNLKKLFKQAVTPYRDAIWE